MGFKEEDENGVVVEKTGIEISPFDTVIGEE